ncbi:antitermination protein NusG [Termitidicoccus mucosus]|uniref:Antitermination protein NusG n=2 Tax=Termitidicoccus mucosus TaxID=1184151 RepID=A0A178IFL2_9BACT|nr:antitermination protein NusG [Opitutaceae bacterium TSB47]
MTGHASVPKQPVNAPAMAASASVTDGEGEEHAMAAAIPRWYVAHTKPRCEKKFAALMKAERFEHELPLIESVRRYGRKKKKYQKPIFPGYVFVRILPTQKPRCFQQELLVRLIEVDQQKHFEHQLEDVRKLVASGLEVMFYPQLKRGATARIRSGPLRGVQGVIDDPKNPGGIVLVVDVLRQGVLVKVPVEDLEIDS